MTRATAIADTFDALSTLLLDVELERSTPEIEQHAAWIRSRLIRLGMASLVEAVDAFDESSEVQWVTSCAELCAEDRG